MREQAWDFIFIDARRHPWPVPSELGFDAGGEGRMEIREIISMKFGNGISLMARSTEEGSIEVL